jgi:hypothetical protein
MAEQGSHNGFLPQKVPLAGVAAEWTAADRSLLHSQEHGQGPRHWRLADHSRSASEPTRCLPGHPGGLTFPGILLGSTHGMGSRMWDMGELAAGLTAVSLPPSTLRPGASGGAPAPESQQHRPQSL